MIPKLQDRLAQRTKTYEELCLAEEKFEDYLKKIRPIISDENMSANIYNKHTWIYISVDSLDDFEMKIMPALSDALGVTWNRIINSDNISYSSFVSEDYKLYISITVKISDSCIIIKQATGRVIKETKYIEIDVPEFEYIVDCSEVDDEVDNEV